MNHELLLLPEIERRLRMVPLLCKKCNKPVVTAEKCEWKDRAGRSRIYQVHDWHTDYAALAREVAQMLEEEREACAKIVDVMSEDYRNQSVPVAGGYAAFDAVAAAIRSQR